MGTFDEKNGGGKSRATVPLTTKYIKSFQRSFVIDSIIVFSFEGIRIHEPIRNSAESNSKKFRGITR